MLKKGTKLFSILKFKCPSCHEGNLYPTEIKSLKGWFNMFDRCPHCNQKYNLEPGFYWGAMYISYMVSSFFMFLFFGLFFFLLDQDVTISFLCALALIALLYVFIFRLARSIWINLYVHYKKQTQG